MDYYNFFNQPPQHGYDYFAAPHLMNWPQYYFAPPPPPMFPINDYFHAPPPFPMGPAFALNPYQGHGMFNMDAGYGFHPMPPPPHYGFAPGNFDQGQQQNFAGYNQGFQEVLLNDYPEFDMPNPENRPAPEMTPVNPMTPTPFVYEEVPQAAANPENRPAPEMTPVNPMTPTPSVKEEVRQAAENRPAPEMTPVSPMTPPPCLHEEVPQAADVVDEEEEDEIIEIKLEPEVIFEAKIEPPPVKVELIIEDQWHIKEEEKMMIEDDFDMTPQEETWRVDSPLNCRQLCDHWEVPIDTREEELARMASPPPARTHVFCLYCLELEYETANKRSGKTAPKIRKTTNARKRTAQAAQNNTPKKRGRPSNAELAKRAAAKRGAGSRK